MKATHCFAAGLALAAGLGGQEWRPGSEDWASLPEVKRTRLQLYLTPGRPTQGYKGRRQVLFLDIRTRAEAMYVGMATPVDALVPYVEHQEIMTEWDDRRGLYRLEANAEFAQEVEAPPAGQGAG